MVNSFWDLLAALGIFVALGYALIATAHFAPPPGAPSLVDLGGLFDDLRGPERSAHYWLFFCLFSTLLLTLAHLGIAPCSEPLLCCRGPSGSASPKG